MTVKSNTVGRIFSGVYARVETTIPFDPKWKEGDYLNSATHHPVPIGGMVKSKDDLGRRIVMVGTRFGTVVVFDRYPNQEEDGVYVTNIPYRAITLRALIPNGALSEGIMVRIFGPWNEFNKNIGFTIEAMADEIKEKE